MKLALAIGVLICLSVFGPSSTKNVGRVAKKGTRNDHVLACEELEGFLSSLEPNYSAACHQLKTARWNYATNVEESTRQEYADARKAFLQFQSETQKAIDEEGYADCTGESDAARREVKYLRTHGPGEMTPAAYDRLAELQSRFELAIATARLCEFQNEANCELRLEPDVEEKLQASSNPDELEWYWTQWHNQIGSAISAIELGELVGLQNQLATSNDFNDMTELWLSKYDDETEDWTPGAFKEIVLSLWNELQPFYSKLHAYVRMQLRNVPQYHDNIKRFGSFPIHYTRNLWSRDWLHLDASTKPFPDIPTLDATTAMQSAGLSVSDIFLAADGFITALGLPGMPQEFWDHSMFERPGDKEVICDATAEDMCSGAGNTDFRVKLCAEVTMKDLLRAAKYTGHVEYFLQYTDQHYIFRSAANPAFFDGIAGTFELVMSTPEFLQCKAGINMDLGFECPLDEPYAPEIDVNYLYRVALEKFPFLAFAFSVNQWRWELYEGALESNEYNQRWYEIREEHQGIRPPAERNSDGVDAAGTFDLLSEDDEFTKQFVGIILQFQIHEALCVLAGEYDPVSGTKPLHQCDFHANSAVGNKIRDVMLQGFSKPWPEILEEITGARSLSTSSILKYFKPLFDETDARLTEAGELACFGKGCQPMARQYVSVEYEEEASRLCNNASLASWAYETDLTNPEAEAENAAANLRFAQFKNTEWKERISQFDLELFEESDEKRQLEFLNSVGVAALETEKLEEFNQILSRMARIYGTAKVCPYSNTNCDLESEGIGLEPDLEGIIASSRNYNELAYVWREWREATGKLMREDYNRYVDLSNEAALLNGYDNMGEFWIHRYESDTFKNDMGAVWDTVKEMYVELHAYVRFRLRQVYPQMVNPDDPIPAHLLGNMWSQQWSNIYSLVLPFEDAPVFDVTDRMKEVFPDTLQGIQTMFTIANNFFTSVGLQPMTMAYGDKAMIIKPNDGREVICHASAWDFCDGQDFRIKMCTNVDMEDFITVHHELGHIQYDLQYKHLNITFREGANPGFHEAIGDVIALSVATPKHMYKLGLVEQPVTTYESTINYLMKMALDKIAFLPFGFLIDSYRWRVFDGQITRTNLTYNWLKMRSDFQGIVPPAVRNEEDFDPGAKFHVPADVPYIRYFFSYILQFQVHRELCQIAGEYRPEDPENYPLHNCDIYQNRAAGEKFSQILASGGSKNWQDLLEEVVGDRTLNAEPLLDYFAPLINFFKNKRAEHGYPSGWNANAFEDYYGDHDLPSTPEYTTQTEEVTTETTTETPGQTDPTTETPGQTDPTTETPGQTDPTTETPGQTDPTTETPGQTDPTTETPGQTDPTTETPGQTDPTTETPRQTDPTTETPGTEVTDPSEEPPGPTTPTTTTPTITTSSVTPTPTITSTTSATTTSTVPPEEDDDDGVNTVALVIGIVLGVVVVVILAGYFITTKLGIGPLARRGI